MEAEEAQEIFAFFCNAVNECEAEAQFSMERNGKNVRVILKGVEDAVMDILTSYYRLGE